MANTKDKHYWNQLRGALTAGQWSSPTPAKAPTGIALSWSELLRKFNKHCRGFSDVAEVASQTHALALLLSANFNDDDQDDIGRSEDSALELGEECLLAAERQEEARVGYDILKKLESANFDTLNFALAYYAYALGNPQECIEQLEKVSQVSHIQDHIPLPGTLRSMASSKSKYTNATSSEASSTTGSARSDATIPVTEIRDGRAWAMTEAIRSICLQGMSREKLSPSEPLKALDIYSSSFDLLQMAETGIGANMSTTSTGKVDFTTFTRFRELWRWVERLIWRAVILSSQNYDVHDHDSPLWQWLKHYSACSAYWPSSFRTAHRSTVSSIYLRALVLAHSSVSESSSKLVETEHQAWMHSARIVIQEYRAILSVSTRFPKAGEKNVRVEDFVDLCTAVWEASGASGENTSWTIDVMWWAIRYTFNSFRVLRHMTRLLYVSGDIHLAKRTLRLYVQVVGKARQASGAGVGADADTDRNWVSMLVFGIRMLCKGTESLPGREGIEDVREAGKLVAKARERLSQGEEDLSAVVDLAEGVYKVSLAIKEQEPLIRPRLLSEAHELFLRSVLVHPTPSGHYHLALSFARASGHRDLTRALEHAGAAASADPTDSRCWHLLGLLSAATEQWDAAVVALDTGSALDEDDEDEEEGVDETGLVTATATPTGHLNGDAVVREPIFVLDKESRGVPPASTLLKPIPDHHTPTKSEKWEHAILLRMTRIAVSEAVDGPEGAAEQLREVFEWIAQQRGLGTDSQTVRSSGDGHKTPSMRLRSPSDLALSSAHGHEKPPTTHTEGDEQAPEGSSRRQSLQIDPVPVNISEKLPTNPPPHINISPASPTTATSTRESVSSSPPDEKKKRLQAKKVQQIWKDSVHKGGHRINTISRKIGGGIRKSNSTPDFHAVLRQAPYQASSIHSRKRISSIIDPEEEGSRESPPPPPPSVTQPASFTGKRNSRAAREARLLSDLWLMSAATFRRLGKIEQARGAIQEAEVKDEANPAVWVQLGLYYMVLQRTKNAVDAFQKALILDQDSVAATVHLCRLYLSPPDEMDEVLSDRANIDLASGLLSYLTQGPGWDVPEAWYFLAKAYGKQGRKVHEKNSLKTALELAESRGVREVGAALGWCL